MKNLSAIKIAKQPTKAIEWVLWTVHLFIGVYIITPLYAPEPFGRGGNASVIANTLGSDIALSVYAIILMAIGTAGLLGLVTSRPWSPRLRQYAAFSIFIVLFYFVLLRIIIFGLDNLIWTSYFINCCVAAVVYLRLKWENR